MAPATPLNDADSAPLEGRLRAAAALVDAARAEAQASEGRFRELVETLHAIVIEADVETGRLTFVSRRAEAILGYPLADWLASPTFWMNHLHPEEREGAASYCRAAIAQGRDHVLEYRMIAADGHVVWLRHTARVIADDAGDARQIRILLVDITDRKRTEMLLGNETHVMEMIAADLPLATILGSLCRAVDDQANESGSAVWLLDGERRDLRVGASSGLPLDLAHALEATVLRAEAAGPTVDDDEPVRIDDPTTDELWADLAHVARRHGMRTCWSVPILAAEGGILGLLALFRRGTRRPLADDRQLMQRVARLSSIAIARAQAREALRESEARYRGIVEDQTELIARATPDGVLTFANDAFCRYVGMERADLLGRPLMALVPESDQPAVLRHLAALGPARPIETIEHRMRTSSGELRWQQWTDRLIVDECSRAIEVQCVGRDVTDRRRAEQALVESEARYRQLFDFAGDAIVVADEDGRYVDVNPQAEKLTGYTRAELLTMRLRDLHPELAPEQVGNAFDILKRRGTLSGEWSLTRKDGTVVMLEYSATRVGPDRYQAAWRDITDRKRAERELRESEQRFQLAARATKDGVWEWDIVNGRSWRSEGFTGLFGYPPEDAVSPITWWRSRIHPDDRERVLDAVRETLTTGGFSSSIAYRFRRRDGSYADVLDRSYVVRDTDGRPLRMIGAMIDVTEQNQTAEAVRKEHALVRLLQVVAVAAHEASTIEDALQTCLDQVCAHTGWPVGHVLVPAGGASRDLVPVAVWHLADDRRFSPFRAALERLRYAPGEGLPGRVFASGHAETLTGGTPGFPAADEAQASGIGTAFAFPVVIRGEVGAVLEFFAPPGTATDPSFLGVMTTIGAQIGRVLERSRAASATRQLLHQVITAQEEERGRLARELHDDTAQALAGLLLGLAGLQKAPNVKAARSLARELHARAAQAMADVRLMARGLRPSALDDLGLGAALHRYALELARTRDLSIEIHADGLENRRLPPDVETALYRIAQEALTNVAKHASARNASVVLARDRDVVRMTLRDDGVGFDPSARDKRVRGEGLGLAGLEQRASLLFGRVEIESAPGRGTTVHVEIPLGGQEETCANER